MLHKTEKACKARVSKSIHASFRHLALCGTAVAHSQAEKGFGKSLGKAEARELRSYAELSCCSGNANLQQGAFAGKGDGYSYFLKFFLFLPQLRMMRFSLAT